MSADIKGYYARLGLAPSATDAEIKAAYRRLAKENHPDVSGKADGGVRFKAIAEAYSVVGDSESRAEYDGLSVAAEATTRTERSAPIQPIECSNCGQVTAQPRYVAFKQVVSFVLGTIRSPIQGIFCAKCARTKALKATAISSVAGWWGVPWGPIWTIMEGVKNAFGGYTVVNANESLLWHNAVAFALRGDDRLALALADKVRSAKDRQLASNAAKLIDHFKSQGVELGSTILKDPWRQPSLYTALQLGLTLAAPLALTIAIYMGSHTESGLQSYLGSTPQSASYSTYSAPPVGSPPTTEATTTTPSAPPQLCDTPPANGEVLFGHRTLSDKGHILDINNGSSGDTIVKVRRAIGRKLVVSFFIRSNEVASLKGIPDGSYIIQYAFGPHLAKNCRSFTEIEAAGQFPDIEKLTTERTEDYLGINIRRMHITYTLYPVPGGNIRPDAIDAAAFDAN